MAHSPSGGLPSRCHHAGTWLEEVESATRSPALLSLPPVPPRHVSFRLHTATPQDTLQAAPVDAGCTSMAEWYARQGYAAGQYKYFSCPRWVGEGTEWWSDTNGARTGELVEARSACIPATSIPLYGRSAPCQMTTSPCFSDPIVAMHLLAGPPVNAATARACAPAAKPASTHMAAQTYARMCRKRSKNGAPASQVGPVS